MSSDNENILTVRATCMDLYTIVCTIESDFCWFKQKFVLIWIVIMHHNREGRK